MAFGTGKDTGLNTTTKRQMEKMVKGGYTPQEISDALQVRLPCILSFYQVMADKTDEEMEEYSSVDQSSEVSADAQAEAEEILRKAREQAADIVTEAKETADAILEED